MVDDEPLVLTVTQRILQSAGYEVLSADDGNKALSLCTNSSQAIDLLLTDIRMPRMNGVELARCIAGQKPGVPIMFMTGYAADSDVKRMLTTQPGLDGHAMITKPFTPQQLTSAVGRLIQSSEQNHHKRAIADRGQQDKGHNNPATE